MLPLEKGSNPHKTAEKGESIALMKRAAKKYRDKLIGEMKAWEAKNAIGRGRRETNDRHINNLSEEIAKIEHALQV